jgi:pimeloyl-ACP methyl ester carboxylesterase
MTTFVLVPGAWHGSWAFESVTPLLEAAGHTVHALTLTGLRPGDGRATIATANLDTHVADVVNYLERTMISDVTLVGHSYAGMVITAAADRAADRIARLVHIDAFVPQDGDSWWSLTSDGYRRTAVQGAAENGYAVRPPFRPPHGGDPRRRPHPLASFLQTVRLTGAVDRISRRDFVYCSGWEADSPFTGLRAKLQADPGWQVHDIPTAHNAMRDDPHGVAALLL